MSITERPLEQSEWLREIRLRTPLKVEAIGLMGDQRLQDLFLAPALRRCGLSISPSGGSGDLLVGLCLTADEARRLNRSALSSGRPALVGLVNTKEALISPWIHEEGACLACAMSRAPELFRSFVPSPWHEEPGSVIPLHWVSAYLAHRVWTYVQLGEVRYFDLAQLNIPYGMVAHHRVLKSPWCPECRSPQG